MEAADKSALSTGWSWCVHVRTTVMVYSTPVDCSVVAPKWIVLDAFLCLVTLRVLHEDETVRWVTEIIPE